MDGECPLCPAGNVQASCLLCHGSGISTTAIGIAFLARRVNEAGGHAVRWVTHPKNATAALEAEVGGAGLAVEYDSECHPDHGYILSDRLRI